MRATFKWVTAAIALFVSSCGSVNDIQHSLARCWDGSSQSDIYKLSHFHGLIFRPKRLVIASESCQGFRMESLKITPDAQRIIQAYAKRDKSNIIPISGSVELRPLRLVPGRVLEIEVVKISPTEIHNKSERYRALDLIRQRGIR